MEFVTTPQKGHFIHGSGTTTVYHRRGLGTVNGIFPIFVPSEADVAITIAEHTSARFVVKCAGNWKVCMIFLDPRETGSPVT